MKQLLPIMLILGFVGMILFGVPMFAMDNAHADNCISSIVRDIPCPMSVSDFTKHHFSGLQDITVNNMTTDSLLALMLAILFLASSGILILQLALPRLSFVRERLRMLELDFLQSRRIFFRWLSLFEHSPTF